MLAEYAKSMRDSSGGKYPILQGACSVVSSLTLAECSGGLAFGLKMCVEGAWRVKQKLFDFRSFVEGAWKVEAVTVTLTLTLTQSRILQLWA